MNKKFMLAVLLSVVAGTSYAGNPSTSTTSEGSAMYKKLDANQDGYISQREGEAMEVLDRNWTAVDANLDGQLDTVEFARFETALKQIESRQK